MGACCTKIKMEDYVYFRKEFIKNPPKVLYSDFMKKYGPPMYLRPTRYSIDPREPIEEIIINKLNLNTMYRIVYKDKTAYGRRIDGHIFIVICFPYPFKGRLMSLEC